jgi:spore coat protein CotH
VLTNPALTDAQRRTQIEALVDLNAYLTFWAGEGLIGHWDGYADDQNNFYFYVLPTDGKIHFIPWGADDTFGRGNPLSGRTGDPVHCQAIVPRSALARRLYAMPDVRALYLARLQLLLDTVWNPSAHLAEIDRMQALIQPYTGDLTSALAPVRTWIADHRARVQAEIAAPPAPFASQPDHFCFFD